MFIFDLQLADGTPITATADGHLWEWHRAFSAACQNIEARLGLPPRSGIRCTSYQWEPGA